VGIEEESDLEWEKKEKMRALDSRKASFGLEASNDIEHASTRSQNNTVVSSALPVRVSSHTPDMSEEPGSTLSGRAVDDAYEGSQEGNRVLVPTGTIIDGVLDRDMISDYTGSWEGHLIQDVYSIDNQFILFPKGTKIMGQSLHIGNVNEPIQNRMGMTEKESTFIRTVLWIYPVSLHLKGK
jgi:type IV secretory pathway VirB10-like protein